MQQVCWTQPEALGRWGITCKSLNQHNTDHNLSCVQLLVQFKLNTQNDLSPRQTEKQQRENS